MAEIIDYISKWRGEEIDSLLGLVSSHVNDATIHLQAGEREKWNAGSGSGGGSSVITNVYWSDVLNRPSWISDTPPEIFDLFEKVITKEAVDEVRDADGNIVTEAQPAEYAIKAKYDLFSVGGISAYGFSGTGSGGGTASVDVTQIQKEGVHIATINGVNIFAPKGGASSWAELTGKPSWLTDTKPSVSAFQNDAGYLTAAALSGYATTYEVDHKDEQVLASVEQNYVKKTTFETYKGEVTSAIANSEQSVKDWVTKGYVTKEYVDAQKITGYGKSLDTNGNYLRLLDENGIVLNKVIAPYAAYTDQLGATGSTAAVSIYGNVTMKNGSLAVAGDVTLARSLTVTGESHFNGAVYLPGQFTFFGQNGIYIQADRTTQSDGTAAYIGVHQSFTGGNTIATVNLDGSIAIPNPMAVAAPITPGISLRVGGTLMTDFLVAGAAAGMARPDGYWFASPNGYFGNPSTKTYTSFGEGGIELSHDTPFIDFHYGHSTADFTSRLIASEDGVVQIQSATTDPALRIGNAYLRYDETNHALYVTGQNGAQVHLYATGGIAAYSGLGSGITQLANLSLTGQLTAASVKANYVGSDGILHIDAGSDSSIILNKNATVDSDGWITTPQLNATQRIVVNSGGDIRIGSIAADHGITDLYADDSYVYITVNGYKYQLYCLSKTKV